MSSLPIPQLPGMRPQSPQTPIHVSPPTSQPPRLNLSEEAAKLEEKRFEEIRRFVKRIFETWLQDSQLPSINKLAEALTTYGVRADELSQAIAEYQANQAAAAAKNAKRARIVALFGVLVICLVGTLLWWRIGQVQTAEMQASASSELATRQIQLEKVSATLQTKQETLARLETRVSAAQEQVAAIARTIQALAGAQQAAQEQASNLQRLNQQFQFRLLQMDGQSGPQVVIQVPADAQPVTVEGKRYIVVAQPDVSAAPAPAGQQ